MPVVTETQGQKSQKKITAYGIIGKNVSGVVVRAGLIG